MPDLYISVVEVELYLIVFKSVNLYSCKRYIYSIWKSYLIDLFFFEVIENCLVRQSLS